MLAQHWQNLLTMSNSQRRSDGRMLSGFCHVTEREEAALACIALKKQQDVAFSDMLLSAQGQLVWVDSDPIWGCGLYK